MRLMGQALSVGQRFKELSRQGKSPGEIAGCLSREHDLTMPQAWNVVEFSDGSAEDVERLLQIDGFLVKEN